MANLLQLRTDKTQDDNRRNSYQNRTLTGSKKIVLVTRVLTNERGEKMKKTRKVVHLFQCLRLSGNTIFITPHNICTAPWFLSPEPSLYTIGIQTSVEWILTNSNHLSSTRHTKSHCTYRRNYLILIRWGKRSSHNWNILPSIPKFINDWVRIKTQFYPTWPSLLFQLHST